MRNNCTIYATRREHSGVMGRQGNVMRSAARGGRASATGWSRNYNTVRHTAKPLGTISQVSIVGLLVLIVGLIYVSQGTQATNYDYQISGLESEISELEAKREDLAVERARLTSIAASEGSTVAANMEVGVVEGYAE